MNDTAELTERQRQICEEQGWSVEDCGDSVELGKYSLAGEDFSFCVEKEDLTEHVKEYAADFDQDEHIEMWIEARHNGARGVPSARELVKDAEAIDQMLRDLAAALAAEEAA